MTAMSLEAGAQTAAPAQTTVELPAIDVNGTAPASAGTGTPADMNDAASAFTVTGEQVNQRIFSRPGEALEIVPGLIITQHSGEGKANQYFLRGFNLDHGTDLAIYVDGMPINMRTHAQWARLFGSQLVDA